MRNPPILRATHRSPVAAVTTKTTRNQNPARLTLRMSGPPLRYRVFKYSSTAHFCASVRRDG